MGKRFDVWALLGEGKQAGWSRVGWDLPSEVVEELTSKPGQYHIEESRPKKERQDMIKTTTVPEHEAKTPAQVNPTMSDVTHQGGFGVPRDFVARQFGPVTEVD